MWLGIVIGLMLGALFESFQAAMGLGIAGAVLGALLTGRKKAQPDDERLQELRLQINKLFFELKQTNSRLESLEQQLAGKAAVAEADARAQAVAEPEARPEPVSAPAPQQEPAPTLPPLEEGELERQALAAALSFPERSGPVSAASPEIPAEPAPVRRSREAPDDFLTGAAPATAATPAPARPQPAPRPESLRRPVRPAPPAEPSWLSAFVARWVIGGNPIVKVGVLILFLGLAFLLRYVAENTTVPIEFRYAGVALAGIGLLVTGWRWRGKADSYGLILQGAGIGVLYLTTLASMKLHPLIPPSLGFAVLIGVAVCAVLLAVLQDALALAVVASLGGFAAPVLASTGSEQHLAFFSYLALLNLGIAAIAWFKAWRVLNLIGFVCTLFLASSWADKYYQPTLFSLAEPFLLFFFVLYVLIAFLFARRTLGEAEQEEVSGFAAHVRQALPQVAYVDASLVFGVPMAAFAMQYLLTREFQYGPAFSALGFGFLYICLAFLLFRRTGMRYALLSETMIALAVIFGSLALPLGLEGEWTSAGWAIEAAGVYWLGVRQQRLHGRLFALLLLAGAALFFLLELQPGTDRVLAGSPLGALILVLALAWTYRLLRQAPAALLQAFEPGLGPWLAGLAGFFAGLLPFLLWPMNWAATALALVGTALLYLARRLPERALVGLGSLLQLAAGGLFLSTLQRSDGGSVLADGWLGLLAAGLIGGAMLAGVFAALGALRQGRRADGEGSFLLAPVLLAGLAFINLAPLFVLPWRLAALIWPLTGTVLLAWALLSGQRLVLAFALALQCLAGLVVLSGHGAWGWTGLAQAGDPAFGHAGFWGPLLIALAALVGGRLLQRPDASEGEARLGWGALVWAGAWWALAWSDELLRLLQPVPASLALVLVALLTATGGQELARRLDWRQAGQATLAYLPVLAFLLALEMVAGADRPLTGWGLLVWPLALAVHLRLLRGQEDWLEPRLQSWTHGAGAWLFILLATLETRAHLAGLATQPAWAWFSWLPLPLLCLWSLTDPRLIRRWPWCAAPRTYQLVGLAPVLAWLLAWCWRGLALEDGAVLLPYVPLMNPLELGQIAILLGMFRWWLAVRTQPLLQGSAPALAGLLGVTVFALISSLVLRSCHQWGQVPWAADALAASMLTQASLSIVWSLLAIGLMLFAHRRAQRFVWLLGAALMAVVVLKLFLVELAASGSLERIVSFIVVGLLLLLVGYFAPLPPRRDSGAEVQA